MAKKRSLPDYETPGVIGSVRGVVAYAQAAKIPVKQARKLLKKNSSIPYTNPYVDVEKCPGHGV